MRKNYGTFRWWASPRVVKHGRRRFRKVSDRDLYYTIRARVLKYDYSCGLTAEGLANELEVPVHRITQMFQRLNVEGLMRQRVNDSKRMDYRWTPSRYPTIPQRGAA